MKRLRLAGSQIGYRGDGASGSDSLRGVESGRSVVRKRRARSWGRPIVRDRKTRTYREFDFPNNLPISVRNSVNSSVKNPSTLDFHKSILFIKLRLPPRGLETPPENIGKTPISQ